MVINFTEEATKIIYFDLEFYVPKKDRRRKPYPFISNPHLEGHILLGGVFRLEYPLNSEIEPQDHAFWIWNEAGEKQLVEKIYQFFTESWKSILEAKKHASLITVGISIARADIPYLFAKCIQHQVDSPEKIYDCFFNLRTIDLNVLGLPYFKSNPNHENVLYPKTKNDLLQRFGIDGVKRSGSSVWDLYDREEYHKIEERTTDEVAEIVMLYQKMCELMGLPSDMHTLEHMLKQKHKPS